MHVIDFVARVVLITLGIAFMASVLVGLVMIGYAVIRDFLALDENYSLFAGGQHSRHVGAILRPWFRRLIWLWVSTVATAMIWVLIHRFFASST